MGLVLELRRRNVFKVGVAYVIVAWLLLQVADVVLPTFRTPEWVMQAFTFLLILGFPLALLFAWAFEITPEGIKLEKHVARDESITYITGRKLDFIIIGLLVAGLGYFTYDKIVLDPLRDAELVQTTTEDLTERVTESVISEIPDKSIAVLCFADLSPGHDQEYFSDGVSEEILNLLAKVPDLRVTSRSSACSFKGQNVDIPTIAAKLNVAHVLEGSVRKAGNRIRITAQLIEVETDTHLWSKTYDRDLVNVFAIQDEIAAAVVQALKITLLGKKSETTEINLDAYALFLQGRHIANERTGDRRLKQAETLLIQVLAIDPGFAPAWTELSRVYQRRAGDEGFSFAEGYELARDAAQQALAIDSQYGPAYAALANIEERYDWDFVAASEHLQRALALSPGDSSVLSDAADLNRIFGHVDEAIDLRRQSIALDPVSPSRQAALGSALYAAQRFEEAVASLRLAKSLGGGDSSYFDYGLGRALLAQGKAAAALGVMNQMPDDGWRLTGIALVQHELGDTMASNMALQELIENYAEGWSYQVAEVYAYRGEIDLAFVWLNRAYDNRDNGLPGAAAARLLANLHNDPRWVPFLDKVGLPR